MLVILTFCGNCGKETLIEDKFCTKCGNPIKREITFSEEEIKNLQDEGFREALVIMRGDEGVEILKQAKVQGIIDKI